MKISKEIVEVVAEAIDAVDSIHTKTASDREAAINSIIKLQIAEKQNAKIDELILTLRAIGSNLSNLSNR